MEFDKFAKDYRKIHTNNVKGISGVDSDYFTEYKIRELYDRGIITPKSKILDMGCGDGNSARYFLKYYPSCEYYGVDISDDSIRIAKRNNVFLTKRFSCYDGRKLPYDAKSFDVVFIACVLHHVKPNMRTSLLKECLRVLKPGGKLIVFEHNPFNLITRKLVRDCQFDQDVKLLSPRYQLQLLNKVGFAKITKVFTLFMPRKKFFEKFLWVENYISWLPIGGQYYTISEKRQVL